MQPTSISVSFRKQVSDGNYGTEAAEITLGYALEEGEAVNDTAAKELLAQARQIVHAELLESPSPRVRAAAAPPQPAPAPRQDYAAEDSPF